MKEILIYKDIGNSMFGETITAESIAEQLNSANGDEINLRINSRGGSVFEGFAIYNLLDQYEGVINTYIDGLAASISSVIALAGSTVNIAKNSRIMIHNAYGGVMGGAKEMRDTAELLDSLTDTIADIYAEKTGGNKDEYLTLMDGEKWYTAEEALDAKLATIIINKDAKVSNKLECPWFNCAPDESETVEKANMAFINHQKRKLKLLADA